MWHNPGGCENVSQAGTFLGLWERKSPLSRDHLSCGQKPAREETGAPKEGCTHLPWVV